MVQMSNCRFAENSVPLQKFQSELKLDIEGEIFTTFLAPKVAKNFIPKLERKKTRSVSLESNTYCATKFGTTLLFLLFLHP